MKKIIVTLLAITLATAVSGQFLSEFRPGHTVVVPSSDGTAIYSQMNSESAFIPSQQLPDAGDCALQSADDFVVPAGSGWDFNRVDVVAAVGGAGGPVPSFVIYIYENNISVPAATAMYMQDNLSYTVDGNVYSISLSSIIHLDPGHYWISVVASMSSSEGLYGWSWFDGTQQWYECANQDPCNLWSGTWPTSWGSSSGQYPSRSTWDLCFALYMDSHPTPLSTWGIIAVIFTIGVSLVIYIRRKTAFA